MTTLDRPTARSRTGTSLSGLNPVPNTGQPNSDSIPGGANLLDDLRLDVQDAGLDSDSINSYALDGFAPASVEKCGASDPQESIDLAALAEQVYLLLRREAYIERERHGARR